MNNPNDGDIPIEVSSPACLMHEAGDAYMGYADKDELIAFLNALLEAEHAVAHVILESENASGSCAITDLVRGIHKDEVYFCAMLIRHIKRLGAIPSPRAGAFYEKARAFADLRERIAFFTRHQGTIVRKLREILPRVRDNQLHADLSEILRSHEANITLASKF